MKFIWILFENLSEFKKFNSNFIFDKCLFFKEKVIQSDLNLSDSTSVCSWNLLLLFLKCFKDTKICYFICLNLVSAIQDNSDHSSLLICVVYLPITVDIAASERLSPAKSQSSTKLKQINTKVNIWRWSNVPIFESNYTIRSNDRENANIKVYNEDAYILSMSSSMHNE